MSKQFASVADLEVKKTTFEQLSAHCWAYTAEGDPNTGVVIGDDAVLICDALATPVMAQNLIAEIRNVTDKPIKYVVLSHYHAVRVLGASGYRAAGMQEIIASQGTWEMIVERGQQDMMSEYERFPRLFQNFESIPGLTWPTLVFPTELTLWMGGLEVRIMHVGAGHTKGDTVVWVPSEKVLFSGDLVEADAACYTGDAQLEEWPATLDALAALGALKKVRALEAELTDQAAREAAERRELLLSVKQYSDQWEKLAKEDSLTGLPNRRALEQWLQSALSRATVAQPTTLLLIDVDHFKQVNDRFGHAIGDRALHQLAGLMRQNCRYADFPARYGGEEFVLALPQTDLATGIDVAQRFSHSVSAFYWEGIQPGLAVTISVGVASTAELATPCRSEALIAAADNRLYVAKNDGRNRVVSAG